MEKLRVATVFSGIGAFEQALIKKNIPFEIVFACDNGEREIKQSYQEIIDYCEQKSFDNLKTNEYVKSLYQMCNQNNYMKESYFANYDIDESKWFEDIRFIDGKIYNGKVDIFVGGSPCQSFSMIGKRAGLEDARGTLFYDYARLINEIKPKVFIYENVPGMLNHDNGNTWIVIKSIFESLGYDIYTSILNASDYGIPQDRKRLFVIGFYKKVDFSFPLKIALETTMFDYLETNVDSKHYLGQKGFEFVTTHPERAKINQKIIRTQKANQQFNWNGDFVFEPIAKILNNVDIMSRAYVGEYESRKGVIRQLSYRECMRLMGFSDTYNIVVPNIWAYRQAGNSIVVNVFENLMDSIFETKIFNNKPLQLATVFSGIGSVEFALKRMNIPYDIVFACDNGEREISYDKEKEYSKIKSFDSIDEKCEYVKELYRKSTNKKNYVELSYLANYPYCKENRYFQDICLLDGIDFKGKVDLFVGGSPCQSFSSVGTQAGLDDTRGTLFFEFARLIKEIEPKVFIYENVRNLINHDNGNTWRIIQNVFDSLGYKISYEVLNSSDYGVPQTRRRLFVIGVKGGRYDFSMPAKEVLQYRMKDFLIDNCSYGNFICDIDGKLLINKSEGKVGQEYYLSPLLYKYVMSPGTKSWAQKPKINMSIARTLLKTMGNRHRAGVDNYYSNDGSEDLGKVRMLTEREAHRLMGYTDDYKIVVSKAQAYKQAGNSIVVDVMMSLIKKILPLI